MPKCSMRNCKNITSRTLKRDGISYLRFPCNPIQCGQWTSIVSKQRCEDFYKPNKSSVVCSEYFLDKDIYVTAKGRRRLLKTAVPTVVIKLPDGGVNTEESTISLFDAENNKKFISPTSSLSIGSILDTPRKVIIKHELQKCRKKLFNKEKVIDNLRKKNSRLVKKAISLKNALIIKKKDLNLTQIYVKTYPRI
ncbi:uncharacterized protein LOC126970119 [Leptidea sinapis]|uniref:uncharacterized protein LOC126970119 n=1 Tax=Leptidea sinapis TaxID=189913 RepID=UPI00212C9401|nr:uncharacterized protein LOC126970119 [Leptidea sinapis]